MRVVTPFCVVTVCVTTTGFPLTIFVVDDVVVEVMFLPPNEEVDEVDHEDVELDMEGNSFSIVEKPKDESKFDGKRGSKPPKSDPKMKGDPPKDDPPKGALFPKKPKRS